VRLADERHRTAKRKPRKVSTPSFARNWDVRAGGRDPYWERLLKRQITDREFGAASHAALHGGRIDRRARNAPSSLATRLTSLPARFTG
jgi:hypothetical protein